MEIKTVWKVQPVAAELYPSIIWVVERGHWMWYTLCKDQVETGLGTLLCHCTCGIFTRRYCCCKACKGRQAVWLPGVTPSWNLTLAVILLSHLWISFFFIQEGQLLQEKKKKNVTAFSQTPKIKDGGNKPKPTWGRIENGSLWSC